MPSLIPVSKLSQTPFLVPWKDTPLLPSLIDSITKFTSLRLLPAAFSLLRHSHSPHLLLRPAVLLLSSSSSDLHSLSSIEQLHAFSISSSILRHSSLLSSLTSFYLSIALFPSAAAVAEESPYVFPWKLLVTACIAGSFSANAFAAYDKMLSLGVVPDCFTYPSLLKACGDAGDLDFGTEIHRRIGESGIGFNLFVANALVAMYLKCDELDVARKLFDEMPERDVVSWNSIIQGYASRGLWKEAFGLFERAVEGCLVVNSVTWNTVIGGVLQEGDHVKALRFVSQMRGSKTGVDFVTMVIGLNACSQTGVLRLGKEVHGLAD